MENNFKVNMNEYLPLRDVVFNTLRQAILKGELAPGERLMEIQLAEKLGVSRTPIREAIRKLELEGLVLMIPRKGAEVARISENNLRDVLEVRRTLEELAVDLACQRMTEDELEELKKQTDHIDWLVSNAGISTYAKYEDYSFEEWTRIVNTNLSVPVFMVKELRSMMVEGGSVLFTGSYAGQHA